MYQEPAPYTVDEAQDAFKRFQARVESRAAGTRILRSHQEGITARQRFFEDKSTGYEGNQFVDQSNFNYLLWPHYAYILAIDHPSFLKDDTRNLTALVAFFVRNMFPICDIKDYFDFVFGEDYQRIAYYASCHFDAYSMYPYYSLLYSQDYCLNDVNQVCDPRKCYFEFPDMYFFV